MYWNEFADDALRVFVEHGKFSHAQLDQVKTLSPRVKLAIALALQAEHQIQIDFRRILHRKERTEHAVGCRLYSYLSRLGDLTTRSSAIVECQECGAMTVPVLSNTCRLCGHWQRYEDVE